MEFIFGILGVGLVVFGARAVLEKIDYNKDTKPSLYFLGAAGCTIIVIGFLYIPLPVITYDTIVADTYKFNGIVEVKFNKPVKIKTTNADYPWTVSRDSTSYKVEVE